jgi:lipid-A-disaccharide synthase
VSDKRTKYALMVAGEASGDLHGANLVRAMKESGGPDIMFRGIGGKEMEKAGVEILVSSTDMAVVGLTEVLSKLITIIRAYLLLRFILKNNPPDLLILIDYPGFNINLAGTARRYGVPVLYYISPQIWAWRSGRVKKISRRVDRMVIVLPFEKEFYQQTAKEMIVEYVGHPLLDNIPRDLDKHKIRKELGLGERDIVLGLLPGSRDEEVKRVLPPMLGAAEILSSRHRDIKYVLPMAATVSPDVVRTAVNKSPSNNIIIWVQDIYKILSVCDLAMVTSGTATLETAIMGVPMVIAYRMSKPSFWVARRVVKVPCAGLVNLVAGKKIVPELIQDEVTPEKLADKILSILENEEVKTTMINNLGMVKDKLGTPGASLRTARIALQMMKVG